MICTGTEPAGEVPNWIFVGSAAGLSYREGDGVRDPEAGPGNFHNVYIQPQAYQSFMENGVFPEKTMLPMETFTSGNRSLDPT